MNMVHRITQTIDSLIVVNAAAVNHRPISITLVNGSASVLASSASHSSFRASFVLARKAIASGET